MPPARRLPEDMMLVGGGHDDVGVGEATER
jgi:hypothetical protein